MDQSHSEAAQRAAPSPFDISTDACLRPSDVWKRLGYRSLNSFNVERLTRPDQHPPFIKHGSKILYRKSEIAIWLERGRRSMPLAA